jgi:hypothetical protein
VRGDRAVPPATGVERDAATEPAAGEGRRGEVRAA